jgi:hypothetical protein
MEDIAFQRSPVGRPLNARPQLLRNNGAQVFKGSAIPVKLLQGLIREGIPKRPDKELGIENILNGLGPHGSVSDGTMVTPNMACVPRIRALWNTTRSRARSIVSVAVEAPSARCAAWIFANGKR